MASQARCVRLDPARAIMTPVNRMRSLLVASLLCVAAAQAPSRSAPFVPIGVWYGGGTARAPMVSRDPAEERDAWRRDLQTISASASTASRRGWTGRAPNPSAGSYRFDALEQLLTLADEAGLRVIVQLYTDAAPEWLGRGIADSSFVTDQGARIGSQASPGYCLDHAGVRADMAAFIGAVSASRRLVISRSTPSIVWSEPHIVNWVWFNTPVEFCYCPHTQARFREWLKAKYRHRRGAQSRVVSHVLVVGPARGAAVRHHPLLHRLHRLEDVHRGRSSRRISS